MKFIKPLLLAVFLSLLACCSAYAQIGTPTTLGSKTSATGGSTITITTTANIVAGNLVVVAVMINNGPTVSSISDGTNSYTKATSSVSGGDCELWYKANAAAKSSGASLTITLSGNPGGSDGEVAVAAQVSGVATTTPLDAAKATATGTNSSPTVTTGTLAQASEIVFGVTCWDGVISGAGTYTEASGFSNLYNAVDTGIVGSHDTTISLSYETVAATTAVTYHPTLSANPNAGWSIHADPFEALATINCTLALLGVGKC